MFKLFSRGRDVENKILKTKPYIAAYELGNFIVRTDKIGAERLVIVKGTKPIWALVGILRVRLF